jgi:hypothetical protein
MTYRYEDNNGFRVIDGVVYEYECERCVRTRGMGHWTQSYLDNVHSGKLRKLNQEHKRLCFPYGDLHEVKRIEQVATSA